MVFLLNHPSVIDTNCAADLEEVVNEVAKCLNDNHLACRFLRGWYGKQVFDIENDTDAIALMEICGCGKSARAIAALCDCFGHHAMWYDGDFRRATNDNIEHEIYEVARLSWGKFYQNIFFFLDAMKSQNEVDAVTSASILNGISMNWTAEAISEFCEK